MIVWVTVRCCLADMCVYLRGKSLPVSVVNRLREGRLWKGISSGERLRVGASGVWLIQKRGKAPVAPGEVKSYFFEVRARWRRQFRASQVAVSGNWNEDRSTHAKET